MRRYHPDRLDSAIAHYREIKAERYGSPLACDADELLSAFVGTWARDRQFGYRLEFCRGAFPPLSHEQGEAITALANEWYWSARLCHGSLDRSKECLRSVGQAVEAARAEYAAIRGRPSKQERLRRLLRERDGDTCWLCGHDLGENCTIEHRVARANGGTWAFANLVLAHRECNRTLGRLSPAAKDAVRASLVGTAQ